MSRPLLLLLLTVLAVSGCSSPAAGSKALAGARSLSLASVTGTSVSEGSVDLTGELAAALRRSLAVRGYEVRETEGGDALVRASWYQENQLDSGGRLATRLGISISFYDREGRRLLSLRSARSLPPFQWNPDRVTAEVAHLLRGLPESGAR